ncbi:MAG: NTP transferase domain-containing protein [Polyangiaceae bacterium]|nr:NTP transferase domain-containing protein [Polyangiaceae bacterium]
MVLAAGLGTRLAPLTDELPKALCPIGDRPQIDHVLGHLARAGVPRAVVNVHHKAEAFDEAWRTAQSLPVELSREEEILGTGGGIARAAALLGEGTVLLWNADILADVDLAALLRAHEASGRIATLAVRDDPRGRVGIDGERVVRLRDSRVAPETHTVEYLGVAVLGASVRERLPQRGCLIADALIPAIGRGLEVGAFLHHGRFADTGSPEEYLAANLDWLAGRDAHLGDGATVEPGVVVKRSIVGRDAHVAGTGTLEACVVWPGARALVPLERAIVTPRGVVSVTPRG